MGCGHPTLNGIPMALSTSIQGTDSIFVNQNVTFHTLKEDPKDPFYSSGTRTLDPLDGIFTVYSYVNSGKPETLKIACICVLAMLPFKSAILVDQGWTFMSTHNIRYASICDTCSINSSFTILQRDTQIFLHVGLHC